MVDIIYELIMDHPNQHIAQDATVIPPSTIQDPIDNPSKPPKVRTKGTRRNLQGHGIISIKSRLKMG
ncbi:hypothetical protein CsSME_00040256 [Camellia sinensis var. sinensis]